MAEILKRKLNSAINRLLHKLGFHLMEYSTWNNLSDVAGTELPMFIDHDGNPCFQLTKALIDSRVFLLTIPKSGTYLIAKILENMGIADCGVHIAIDHVQDNRFAQEEILKRQPWRYLVNMPFKDSTRLIRNGQLAFGHIPCTLETERVLEDFKKVVSYREMRDVIISLARYLDLLQHEFVKPEIIKLCKKFKEEPMGTEKLKLWFSLWGKEYKALISSMIPWKDRSDVFQLRFEDIMGDNGTEAQISMLSDLACFLNLEVEDT